MNLLKKASVRGLVGSLGAVGFVAGGVSAFLSDASTELLAASAVLLVIAYLGDRLEEFGLKWGDKEATAVIGRQLKNVAGDVESLIVRNAPPDDGANAASWRISLDRVRAIKESLAELTVTRPLPSGLDSGAVEPMIADNSVVNQTVAATLVFRSSKTPPPTLQVELYPQDLPPRTGTPAQHSQRSYRKTVDRVVDLEDGVWRAEAKFDNVHPGPYELDWQTVTVNPDGSRWTGSLVAVQQGVDIAPAKRDDSTE